VGGGTIAPCQQAFRSFALAIPYAEGQERAQAQRDLDADIARPCCAPGIFAEGGVFATAGVIAIYHLQYPC
jgi:hypothetical protein